MKHDFDLIDCTLPPDPECTPDELLKDIGITWCGVPLPIRLRVHKTYVTIVVGSWHQIIDLKPPVHCDCKPVDQETPRHA